MNRFFTSESVSIGHPDKLADQISDAVLDEFIAHDVRPKVACETFITDGLVVVGGEAHSSAYVDIQNIARSVIRDAGYKPKFCFDPENCGVINTLHEQSQDIRIGVDKDITGDDIGAGDQGIMFGYAVKETDSFMPIGPKLANDTMRIYHEMRNTDREFEILGPDAKCQYTIMYSNGLPVAVSNVLFSVQHLAKATPADISHLVSKVLSRVADETKGLLVFNPSTTPTAINPTGSFVIGGPKGDTGLTGRKIIVDTYGGFGSHGGGAFSGKDPTKVDRSGAYMARHIAKNIVAFTDCHECLVQLSYMIGVSIPSSVYIKTDKGEEYDEKLMRAILTAFHDELTPAGIIKKFKMWNPIYRETAAFGHFGRTPYEKNGMMFFPWECLDPKYNEVLNSIK